MRPLIPIVILIALAIVSISSTYYFVSKIVSSSQKQSHSSIETIVEFSSKRFEILNWKLEPDNSLVLGLNFEKYYFCDCEDDNCDVCFEDISNYHYKVKFYGNLKARINPFIYPYIKILGAYRAYGSVCVTNIEFFNDISDWQNWQVWTGDDWKGCDNCDTYRRVEIYIENISKIYEANVIISSDDCACLWVNNKFVDCRCNSSWGYTPEQACHTSGPGSATKDILPYLKNGKNTIYIWCSERGGNEYCSLTLVINGEYINGTLDEKWVSGGLYVNFLSNGIISVPNTPAAYNGSKTIVAIVNPIHLEGGERGSTIATTMDPGWENSGFSFTINIYNKLMFKIGNGSTGWNIWSSKTVALNKENFIAVAFNQSNYSATFYINGEKDGPYYFNEGSWYLSKSNVYLGGEDGTGNEHGIEAIFYELLVYNRTLSHREMISCYRNIKECPRDDSLVLHLSFDEGRSKYINDLSFIKRNSLGNYIKFDGKDDYIYVEDSEDINFSETNQITVCVRFSGNLSKNIWQEIVMKGNATHREFYLRPYYPSPGKFEFCINNKFCVRTNNTYEDWKFHFVCGVYDGKYSYIYVNGKLDNRKSLGVNIPYFGKPIVIGRLGENDAEYLEGKVSEVYIFNRALSQHEVSLLYNNFTPFFKVKLSLVNLGNSIINTEELMIRIRDKGSNEIVCDYDDFYLETRERIKPNEEKEIIFYPNKKCFNRIQLRKKEELEIEVCLSTGFCLKK